MTTIQCRDTADGAAHLVDSRMVLSVALTDSRLPRVLRFIEENLKNPNLGIGMLQSAFHVSRPTLHRMFRAAGGASRYIRERRLLVAHQYIHNNPDSSITFLLYDLGFASDRQFQRAFHAYFGMSAAQWRQCCRPRRIGH